MRVLFGLMRRRPGRSLAALLISVLFALAVIYWNAVLMGVINAVSEGRMITAQQWGRCALAMGLWAVTAYARSAMASFTCETYAHDLRMGFARRLLALDSRSVGGVRSGEVMSVVHNELAEVSDYMTGQLFDMVNTLTLFLVTFSYLLRLDPLIALLTNAPSAVIMVYTVFSSRVIGAASKEAQAAAMATNGYAEALLSAFPVLKLFSAQRVFFSRFDTALKDYERGAVRRERRSALLMSLSGVLSRAPLIMLLFFGGGRVIAGAMSIGTLYIFLNLSGNVNGFMMNLPSHIAGLRRFLANMERIASRI